MLAEAEETGVIEEAEEEMIYKVFDFAEKEVHDVMVPRPEVVGVSVELPAEQCLAAIIDSPVHALPGIPRDPRRDRRDPARSRSLLRAVRERHRERP